MSSTPDLIAKLYDEIRWLYSAFLLPVIATHIVVVR